MEKVLLFIDNRINAELLRNLISGQYEVKIAEDHTSLYDTYDLGIFDAVVYNRFRELLKRRKLREEPVFLPHLLMANKNDLKFINSRLWSRIDDVIRMPVIKAELTARISNLLKIRRFSNGLAEKVEDLTAFTNNVAHDLGRPLRASDNYLRQFREKFAAELTPDSEMLMNKIFGQNERMSRLISDLLRFAKAGLTEVRFSEFDLTNLIDSCLNELRVLFPLVRYELAAGESVNLKGDPTLIRHAFLNILHNSFKFSKPDSPLSIGIENTSDSGYRVVTIRDNGTGFTMTGAMDPFKLYERQKEHTRIGGYGIGLSIVKLIIERHGGHVTINSNPGDGTAVTLFFPLEADYG